MDRRLLEDISGMYSLMERMDRHMSGFQAEYNRMQYLIEADDTAEAVLSDNGQGDGSADSTVQAADGNNKAETLNPVVELGVTEDMTTKPRTKMVKIVIHPLFESDAMLIKRTPPYSMDVKCSVYRDGKHSGISFYTLVPVKEIDSKQKDKPQPEQEVVSEAGMSSLKKKLLAKKGISPDNPAQSSDVTITAQADASSNQKDSNKVKDWLTKYYMGIVRILEKCNNSHGKYTAESISRMKDINKLYQIYLAIPSESDTIYITKSIDEMKNEIAKALASGTWDKYLQTNINPLDIKSMVYGNIISARNQNIIAKRAADLGINPGDPNYPTLIMSPGAWYKFFKRVIVNNPAATYPLTTPRTGSRGPVKAGSGTKGHFDSFSSVINSFGGYIGYDVSDTEPEDPNVQFNPITDLPGLLNNLTGELNQLAVDDMAAMKAAKEANLTDEQRAAIDEVQTEDGQCKVFNRALINYVETNGNKIKLVDAENSDNPVGVLVDNIFSIATYAIESAGYSNPSIANPLIMAIAFGIGCYTNVGKEVLANNIAGYNYNIKTDWNKCADSVIQTINSVVASIHAYLNNIYRPISNVMSNMRDDGSNNVVVVAPGQEAAVANAIEDSSSALNEMIDNISRLLDDF